MRLASVCRSTPGSLPAACVLMLALCVTSDARAAGDRQAWDVARAQLLGLCQDRAAGRPVAEPDVERLAQQEEKQRAALLADADRALVLAVVDESRARLDAARERFLAWGKAHLPELRELVARAAELLARKPGKAAPAQQDALLQAMENFDAGVSRIQGVSGEISGAGGDEFLVVLTHLLDAARPVVDAGADVRPALLRGGFAQQAEVAQQAALEARARQQQVLLDQGDAVAALSGLVELLGSSDKELSPSVIQARQARQELHGTIQGHDEEMQRCRSGAAAAAAAAAAAPAPERPAPPAGPPAAAAAAPPPAPAPAPTAAAAPEPAPSGAAATAPPGPQSTLAEQLGYWATHAAADPGPPQPQGEAGYLPVGRWLVDPAAAARRGNGAPFAQRSGGLILPVGLWPAVATQIEPQPPPVDATRSHFGGLGEGDSAVRREALQQALEAGKKTEALVAYRAITGEPVETARPAVEQLLEERSVARRLTKPAGAAGRRGVKTEFLAAMLPPSPPDKGDPAEELARARRELAGKGQPRRYSSPGPLAPPAVVTDGSKGTELELQEIATEGATAVQAKVQALTGKLVAELEQAKAALEEQNRAAREAHLAKVRVQAYGRPPATCPAGQEPCLCPELHIPEAHDGLCHPPGMPCVGTPPVSLEFAP